MFIATLQSNSNYVSQIPSQNLQSRDSIDQEVLVSISNDRKSWYPLDARGPNSWMQSLKAIASRCDPTEVIDLPVLDSQVLTIGKHTSQFSFAAPIVAPEKIICIGKNYSEHANEMGGVAPEVPVVFNKFPSALLAHQHPIRLPAISDQVDFEAELVVVIGKEAKNVAPQRALEHVFGYTIGNDVSARDWQKGKPGGQWLVGKTFDTFAPSGPWIVTRDAIEDPQNLDIELRLNGKVMQQGNTADMIFPIADLISHLSKFCTLRPGDLLFSGTPAGVGAGRNPPVFLQENDQIEVEISGIGQLENKVTKEVASN